MIWKFAKKYFFLLLSFALIILAGIQYFSAGSGKEMAEFNYSKGVQQKVTESLQTAGKELAEVTKIYQDGNELSFTNLNIETEFPFYVFKNKDLIYWSDHRYAPSHQSINGFYEDGLLVQKNHIHLVRKQDFFHNQSKIELVSLIPVYVEYEHENEYLKSHFNNKLFKTSPLRIKNKASSKAHLNIHDQKDRFLFSMEPQQNGQLYSSNLSNKVLVFLSLAFLSLGIYLLTRLRFILHKHGFEFTLALVIIYMVLVRWFMLSNSLPYSLYETDLFNPKYFTANVITPSLGDLILNTFCLVIIALFIPYRFHKSAFYRKIIKTGNQGRSVISILTIVLSTAVTFFCHQALINLYEKSNYMLDFSVSTSFDHIKLGVLVFYVLLALLFFLSQHLLIGIFLRLNNRHKSGLSHWIYGVILSAIILLFFGEASWVLLIGAIYFLISYWFKFPLFLYTLKYPTSIYFFLGAFIFTLISMQVLYQENKRKAVFDKLNFGKQFLAENDALGEGLLNKVILSIKNDSAVQNAIQRPALAREAVSSLVKENHLELYFDKYETEVYAFNALGKQLGFEENLPSLKNLENRYKKPNYTTTNANIFFIDETSEKFIKQYIVFIALDRGGTVVLDMKQRNVNKRSVYPELLMEKKLSQNPEIRPFSYAIYDNKNELIYSGGKYNYHKYALTDQLVNNELFTDGIQFHDFNHLGVKNDAGRKIIVSTDDNELKSLLSDFSFLFLVLVSVIFLIILFYAFSFGMRKIKMNFSTKIQVYLNAAFLLPFMLLLLVTIGIIRSTLLNIQKGFYFENTQNISSTFRIHLQNLNDGRYSRAYFEQEINKLAQDTRSDINYFNEKGQLVYSSRPLIYEYNLLSEFINPGAYQAIVEENENEILLSEKLGDLEYRSAYMAIKDGQNKQLGIIGVPFFNSATTLESQLKEVFTTILSVCIAMFLALLVLSYYASGQLTNPLQMVAQKIKRISLNEVNEPIYWEADDEIGVLTGSYNQMLKKLEESKDALSQSEKQSAWREMARQVAHEIKNPLTPMKLSIQQLQRTLPTLEDDTRGRIERSLNSLNEQIDNISEIANSFSEFAKMPVPRSEVFELGTVVQRTAYLYAQDNGLDINIDIKDEGLMVRSDHQLINRVVTNLIINGIQSVPEDRKPQIEIKVYGHQKDKFAIIEVKDNGNGIPEEIRKKVFMPNFSTKIEGSGLGLSMAKRGVEHSGGNIWFETDEKKGTTFYVDLPLVRID